MNEHYKIRAKLTEAFRLVDEAQDHYNRALNENDIHTTALLPPPDNEDCPVVEVGALIRITLQTLSEAESLCKDLGWPDDEKEDEGVQPQPITRLEDHIEKVATDINKVARLGVN